MIDCLLRTRKKVKLLRLIFTELRAYLTWRLRSLKTSRLQRNLMFGVLDAYFYSY